MKVKPTMLGVVADNIGLYAQRDFLSAGRVLFAGRRKAPIPKAGSYPRALKTKAQPIWDEVVETYGPALAEIRKAHNTDWEYAAAVILLRKTCAREGIGDPFDVTQQRREVSVAFRRTAGSVYQRFHQAHSLMGKVQKALVKADIIDSEPLSHAGPKFIAIYSPKSKTYAVNMGYELMPRASRGRAIQPDFVDAVSEVLLKKISSALRFKRIGKNVMRGFDAKDAKGKKAELIRIRFAEDGMFIVSVMFTEGESTAMFGAGAKIKNNAIDSWAEFARKNNGLVMKTIEQELGPYAEAGRTPGRAAGRRRRAK